MTQLRTQPPFHGKGRITQVAEQGSNKMEPRTLKNQSQVAELAPNQGTANVSDWVSKLLCISELCASHFHLPFPFEQLCLQHLSYAYPTSVYWMYRRKITFHFNSHILKLRETTPEEMHPRKLIQGPACPSVMRSWASALSLRLQ